ncbi:MAG TPA: GNAT family N-acetyltransferase, partial [Nocardioides sp.]|nr:GNAT family N-acetyltransferase [Nocardioides sp.]
MDPEDPHSTGLEVPELVGDGFRLRAVRDDDAPRIHQGTAEPATERWLGHKPAPYTLEHAEAYVERRRDLLATGECVTWAIAYPEDDRLLGTVLWFNHLPEVECEIGWWL